MRNLIKQHKAAAAAIAVVSVGVIAWLAFGIFGVHTLFTDKTVDESGPVFDSAATTAPPADAATNTGDTSAAATQAPPPDEATPDETTATGPATAATEAPTATTAAQGGVATLAQGSFAGADASHDVAGDAIVLGDGSDQRFLRFENFEATNGPDLKVYLRAADGDYVSLGSLKGNIGNQNYEVPADVDLATYSEVQIWCERFGVNFGSAILA